MIQDGSGAALEKARFGRGGGTNASDVGKLTEMERTQNISRCVLTKRTSSFGLMTAVSSSEHYLMPLCIKRAWYDHNCLTNPATDPQTSNSVKENLPWRVKTVYALAQRHASSVHEEGKGLSTQFQTFRKAGLNTREGSRHMMVMKFREQTGGGGKTGQDKTSP